MGGVGMLPGELTFRGSSWSAIPRDAEATRGQLS
jgi:hypothetical protein